jgi:hypothetical protein
MWVWHSPMAVVAVRGMYGGFLIGAGLLFDISAIKSEMAHFGLIALAVIVGSILASRVFGKVAGRVFPTIQLSYALIEVASFVVTTALLAKGDFS